MKNKSICISFFLLLVFVSTNAHAVLGLPDKTGKFGFSLGAARLQIADPAGKTSPTYALQPVKIMYSDWLGGGYRYWMEVYYQEASFTANENSVGQYFQQSGGRFVVQKNFKLADFFKPWIGLGMDFSAARYSKRHTKDDEGYLLDLYENRLRPTAGALIYFVNEWQISKEWTIGSTLLQRFSLDSGVNESSLSAFFLTRF